MINLPNITWDELVEISAQFGVKEEIEELRASLIEERPELMKAVFLQLKSLPRSGVPTTFYLSGFLYGIAIINELLKPKVTLQ